MLTLCPQVDSVASRRLWTEAWQMFSIKGQTVNISVLVGHMVSVTIT